MTTKTSINIYWLGLQSSQNGGSPILGYELWRDDGHSGDFVNLYYTDTNMALGYIDRNV